MHERSRPVSGPQPGSGLSSPSAVFPGPQPLVTDRRRSSPLPAKSVAEDAERREADERTLIELRRKVQKGDLLSASTERLLWKMRFNGHLTLVIQNGRVMKSGYEEGYFRRRNDLGGFLLDT